MLGMMLARQKAEQKVDYSAEKTGDLMENKLDVSKVPSLDLYLVEYSEMTRAQYWGEYLAMKMVVLLDLQLALMMVH